MKSNPYKLNGKLFRYNFDTCVVELIQKEDPNDDRLSGLQARHYQRYLDGMKKCLLDRLPSIGTRTGAWTSGLIKGEEAPA